MHHVKHTMKYRIRNNVNYFYNIVIIIKNAVYLTVVNIFIGNQNVNFIVTIKINYYWRPKGDDYF